MLALTLKRGERVRIRTSEGDLWLAYLGQNGRGAQLTFDGPRLFDVKREKLLLPGKAPLAGGTTPGTTPAG